jgi:hypothetical protein
MSALPPKADIVESDRDVRIVPKADIVLPPFDQLCDFRPESILKATGTLRPAVVL